MTRIMEKINIREGFKNVGFVGEMRSARCWGWWWSSDFWSKLQISEGVENFFCVAKFDYSKYHIRQGAGVYTFDVNAFSSLEWPFGKEDCAAKLLMISEKKLRAAWPFSTTASKFIKIPQGYCSQNYRLNCESRFPSAKKLLQSFNLMFGASGNYLSSPGSQRSLEHSVWSS